MGKKYTMTLQVAFDESGNTGYKLLDPAQPVFVLSSVFFTKEEADELIKPLCTPQTKEIKFKNIIKRKNGEKLISNLFKNPIVNNYKVKISVNHKSFFLFTKIIDILLESMLYEFGYDFYENGNNIATANMMYLVTPVFCGYDRFNEFQNAFIEMVVKQTAESITAFYKILENLIINSSHKDYCIDLSLLLETKRFAGDILRNFDKCDLDPALPSLIALCDKWGRQFDTNFDLYHDNSKVIERYKKFLKLLMTKDAEKTEIGYDNRTQLLPIRANGINFANSSNMPQIQLADIFAGASAFSFKKIIQRNQDDFSDELLEIIINNNLVSNHLWPSEDDVTADHIRKSHKQGKNLVNGLTDFIIKYNKNNI